jgi:hypothetical protein
MLDRRVVNDRCEGFWPFECERAMAGSFAAAEDTNLHNALLSHDILLTWIDEALTGKDPSLIKNLLQAVLLHRLSAAGFSREYPDTIFIYYNKPHAISGHSNSS